jgi:signal transduction histidine kinase
LIPGLAVRGVFDGEDTADYHASMRPGGKLSDIWRLRAVRDTLDRITIRGALFVGYGLILALWLASGVDLVRRIAEVEIRANAVGARLIRTEHLLSTISAQVLLGSVYLRDALLDTPDTADYYRAQLQSTRVTIEQALAGYVPVVDSPGERATFGQLKAEIQDFWNTVLPVLSWDPGRRATEARAVLRGRIIPKREVIIRISDRIRTLNHRASDEQQAEVARIYSVARRRVWETSLEMLLIGACVALVVTRYAGRLERRIRENTRSLQRLSAKLVRAQEEERRTIARELHDEIGQELTGVKVELALAERSLPAETRSRNLLGEARTMTDRALQTVRDLSQLLHPPMLDDLGLAATLEWFLGAFSRRTGIAVDLAQDGDEERLVPELEMCLYRIVQEATTNIARHAEARTCRVSVRRAGTTARLVVEDDGRGFNVEEVVAPGGRAGLGLLGMQERVAGFGGVFRVESRVGQWTRVSVELPALVRPPGEDVVPFEPSAGPPATPGSA